MNTKLYSLNYVQIFHGWDIHSYEDNLKYKIDLKYDEDALKIEDNLKNDDDLK